MSRLTRSRLIVNVYRLSLIAAFVAGVRLYANQVRVRGYTEIRSVSQNVIVRVVKTLYNLIVSIPREHDVRRTILKMNRQALDPGQSISEVSKVCQHFHDSVSDLEV